MYTSPADLKTAAGFYRNRMEELGWRMTEDSQGVGDDTVDWLFANDTQQAVVIITARDDGSMVEILISPR